MKAKDALIVAMETHRGKTQAFDVVAWYNANEQAILATVFIVCVIVIAYVLTHPAKVE